MLRGPGFFARPCLRIRTWNASRTLLFTAVMFCSLVGIGTSSWALLNNNFITLLLLRRPEDLKPFTTQTMR